MNKDESQKSVFDTLKDPIVLGSIGMAVASQNASVGDAIKQAPELVSAIISLVTFFVSLFRKKR